MAFETVFRWLGGFLAFAILGFLLYSVWIGTKRQAGQTVGRQATWLRSPLFYLAASALFFWLSWLG